MDETVSLKIKDRKRYLKDNILQMKKEIATLEVKDKQERALNITKAPRRDISFINPEDGWTLPNTSVSKELKERKNVLLEQEYLLKNYLETYEDRFNFYIDGAEKEEEIPDVEYILDKLIPKKIFGIFAGESGSYKTATSLYLGLSLASGKDFLGYGIKKPVKVLYIDEEANSTLIKKRKTLIKKGLSVEDNSNFIYMSNQKLKLGREEDFKHISEFIKQNKIEVIIIDSLPMIIDFNENQAADFSNFYGERIKTLIEEHDISILAIHHVTKGRLSPNMKPGEILKALRGTISFGYLIDTAVAFINKEIGKDFYFYPCKLRYNELLVPNVIGLEWTEEYLKFFYKGQYQPKKKALEQCQDDILEYFKLHNIKEYTTSEKEEVNLIEIISSKNGHSRDVILKANTQLKNNGKVEALKKRGWYKVVSQN